MPSLLLPRNASQTIDLTAFTGKTYLQTTFEAGDGIDAKTAVNDSTAVTIATPAQISAALGKFDPKVAGNLYSHFNNGQTDFLSAAGKISGQSLSPQQIEAALLPHLLNVKGQVSEANAAASDVILLASGSGTVVLLNADDYFYNVAYQSPQLSSGRSYGVTATRKLLGPTDNDYLTEMGNYLKSATAQEMTNFYTAMFKILTATDTSDVSGLSAGGQAVLTDFLAIYTAESMRHDMVNLDVTKDAWEMDIAEVTLLGAYITASGMVMTGGKLVAGNLTAYYDGHSIGTHEADFTKLAKLLTSYEDAKGHHRAMVTAIDHLTPVTPAAISSAVKGDVFRRALVYLNRTEFESHVKSNAAAITGAMVQLLNQIRTDQSAITAYVLAHQ
jgi:hypothetical protein